MEERLRICHQMTLACIVIVYVLSSAWLASLINLWPFQRHYRPSCYVGLHFLRGINLYSTSWLDSLAAWRLHICHWCIQVLPEILGSIEVLLVVCLLSIRLNPILLLVKESSAISSLTWTAMHRFPLTRLLRRILTHGATLSIILFWLVISSFKLNLSIFLFLIHLSIPILFHLRKAYFFASK